MPLASLRWRFNRFDDETLNQKTDVHAEGSQVYFAVGRAAATRLNTVVTYDRSDFPPLSFHLLSQRWAELQRRDTRGTERSLTKGNLIRFPHDTSSSSAAVNCHWLFRQSTFDSNRTLIWDGSGYRLSLRWKEWWFVWSAAFHVKGLSLCAWISQSEDCFRKSAAPLAALLDQIIWVGLIRNQVPTIWLVTWMTRVECPSLK